MNVNLRLDVIIERHSNNRNAEFNVLNLNFFGHFCTLQYEVEKLAKPWGKVKQKIILQLSE